MPEYKSTVAKKPRWVLSHYGVVKTCWDVLVLMATIYVAIVVPYNAAFHEPVTCRYMRNVVQAAIIVDQLVLCCRDTVVSNVHVVGNSIVDTSAVVDLSGHQQDPRARRNTDDVITAKLGNTTRLSSADGSFSNASVTVVEEKKKSSIVVDVFVEAIFIIG